MEVTPGADRDDGRGLIGRTIGHYIVESTIGKGGMGEVYLARDTRLPRHVALKRMAPELRDDLDYRRRFQEEADKAIRISDNRIAGVLDVVEDQDEIFIVLEYVPGPSLRQRLRGPIDLAAFLPLAVECTQGLAAAHRSGIVHRDIKPENYVIGPRGAVKLLDLGVAKLAHRSEGDSTIPFEPQATRPTLIGGTPAYMAPEALLGVRSDFRSDIFSLGVMFYEMLSGEHPFRAATQPATQDRILHEEPRALASVVPTVPPKLDRLVTRMISKDAEQRPATAHDVLHDLLEIEQHREEGDAPADAASDSTAPQANRAAPASAPSRPSPSKMSAVIGWAQRHRRAAIIGTCSLAAAIAVAVLIGKVVFEPPIPLPGELRVRLSTFTAPHGSENTRIMAAGISRLLEPALRRLTDANVLDAVPRKGRHFQPLYSVTRAADRRPPTVMLSGTVSEKKDDVEIRLDLRSGADSSLLRSTQVAAPRTEPLALLEQTLGAVAGLLDLDITPEELALVWHPSTRDNAAYSYDLRAQGYMSQADAFPALQVTSTSPLGAHEVRESGENPLEMRAACLDSAGVAYRFACARDSMDADAWYGRALVQWKKHESARPATIAPEVSAWCQRALQIDLDHPDSHALLGECYTAAERDPAAIAEFERAVVLNPTDYPSVLKLAHLYERSGRSNDTENLYLRQIRRFPASPYWYTWNANFHFRRAEHDSAATYYQKALDREPDEETSLAGMGAACLMQGRYESAIPYLRQAIVLKPSALRYSNLGTVLFLTRRLAAAESAYAKALTLNPNYYMLWGNLGDSQYWNPEARHRAPEAYRRAIALAIGALVATPGDPLIRVRLAAYHAMIGDLSTARTELRMALAGDAGHDVLYKAALVYSQFGEADSAFVYLQRALDAGFSELWMKDTPELDDLRPDPRFGSLRTMASAAH